MAQKYLTYGPDAIGALLTSTLSAFVSENLEDQVFGTMPLWNKLKAKAKSKDGGASLLQPVMYEKNDTAAFYSGFDILNTTPQNGFTMTQAKWKSIAGSISIAGDEEDQNQGKSKILNLLEIKTDQLMQSLRDKCSEQLFAASTSSKQLRSLVTMIDATSTIQDVNSTSQSWWQALVTTGGSFVTQGLDDLRITNDQILERNPASMLDMIVTTRTVKNYYEASQTPMIRYGPGGAAKPTFDQGLYFRGAEMFSDPNATSGVIYMFSTDDLYLVVNSNADMKSTPFVKPVNQDARTAQVILRCELVTRARRKLAKITSVTA